MTIPFSVNMANSKLTPAQIQAYVAYAGTSAGPNFVYAGASSSLMATWSGPGLLIVWESTVDQPAFAGSALGLTSLHYVAATYTRGAVALKYEWANTNPALWKFLVIH